jgi:hypothetical protein
MSDRITQRDLEAVCARINRAVNGTDETPQWERTDGGLRQNPGIYHLSGAYGGWSLHRSCELDGNGESHGVSDVFGCGHVPKRELYGRMQAFLAGLEAAA